MSWVRFANRLRTGRTATGQDDESGDGEHDDVSRRAESTHERKLSDLDRQVDDARPCRVDRAVVEPRPLMTPQAGATSTVGR